MRRRDFIQGIVRSAAWPLAARAEHSAMPLIGFLNLGTAESITYLLAAFRHGVAEAGYVEGKNVVIEYRFCQLQTRAIA